MDKTGTSNHNENDLVLEGYEGYKVLSWAINMTLPDDEPYTSDVVITESLPAGVHILPGVNHPGDEKIIFYVDVNYNLNQKAMWDFNFVDGTVDNTKSTILETNAGICTLTKKTDDTKVNYSVWARKLNDSTYEIHIPKELANYLIEKKYNPKIEVYAYIDENYAWDGFEHDFTNNVTVTYENNEIGSSSQTQHITRNAITKEAGTYDTKTNQMPYSITINPSGKDLVVGSDTLTLTDELRYVMPGTRVDAALVYDSVRVFCTDTEPETDITEQCAYTVESDEIGNAVSHSFRMIVPDGVPLRLEYVYQMSGRGVIEDLSNTVSLQGNGSSSDSGTTVKNITVQKSTAGAVVVGINVYKVDSQNYGVHLNGAKFTLEKWSGTAWIPSQTYVTDNNGMFNTGTLDYNVAYRLIETEAPAGYEMKEATAYEFYVVNDTTGASVRKPADFDGHVLNDGSTVTIQNDAAPYELPETGGMGTAMYYAVGGMLMLAAAGLTVFRKRKSTVR